MTGRTELARHPREHGCGSSLSRPTRRRLLAGAAGLAAGSCLLSGAAPSAATLLDIQPFAGPVTDPGGVPLNGAAPRPGAPLDGDVTGALSYLITDGERTLIDIALERDLGILSISALNPGIDVWVPGAERLVALPTAWVLPEHERRGIIVNLAELRLYHFPEPDTVPNVHTIGIGRDGFTTPLGPTTVTRKQADPTWYPTAATRADRPELPAVVPPGPDNPLGRHAIYLGFPTYLIHGTNRPYGVGRRVSRGCIRMYPDAVATLFGRVPIGLPVRIMDDPIKLGWAAGDLYLEVHPDLEQFDELEATYHFTKKPPPDVTARIVAKAGEARARLAWDVIERELIARRGIPIRITRPEVASADRRHRSTIPSDFIGIY
jgi:L,D-transpeptidase ErfK/SrfK